MVAISLNLLVVAMIITVGVSSLRHIRTIRDHRNLYATTSFLNNQFNYWIKQGTVVTALNPTTLEIRLPDNSTKIIAQNGNLITIDGEPLIAHNVTIGDLAFTEMDHSVRITFTLNTGNPTTTFSATTTVAQRN